MKRMYSRSSMLIGVVSAAVLFLGQAAMAHPPGGPPDGPPDGPGMDGHLERRLDKLGLSSDQSDKVHAILDAAKAKREEQRPQIEAAMDQMHTLLEQDPPDETAIMQQADKLGTLKTEGHKEMLHTLLQVRAQLTPAQRDQLKTMHPHGGAPPWHHHRGCGKGTPCPEDQ